MFKQIFESDTIPYLLPTGAPPYSNGYLITPPRIYSEELSSSKTMFVRRDPTADASSTISIMAWMDQIYYPTWSISLFRFDATTGAFISRDTVPWGAVLFTWTGSLTQGFDGSLWATVLSDLREYSGDLTTIIQSYTAAHFGRTSCSFPVVDKTRDIIIMASEASLTKISVYTLSTGALIREVGVSDQVKYICPVDDTRVFVLGKGDILNLVDYERGVILMTARCPRPTALPIELICWDVTHRRLLVFSQGPNATDGACTSRIHGYYPVPKAVDLTTPIPLVAPRKGRVVPVATRMVGDVGEPIVGRTIASVADANSIVQNPSSQSDGLGYVTTRLECVNAASTDLTITTSV